MLIQKTTDNIFANYSSSITLPKLIEIQPNLIMASFELMKLIPAKYVIMKALKENKIDPSYPIVETSSGSYALGLAIVCAELKIPFFIISDPVIDNNLINKLNKLGGKVQIISSKKKGMDIEILRMKYLQDFLKANQNTYWTNQYNNSVNRQAYSDFADYLVKTIGSNFTLVGAVGSGGSTCGTIEKARTTNANIKLVGVDTFGSVLFGLPKKVRKIRGLGSSMIPDNLIHEYFDQVHWITAESAFKYTRELYSSKSIFCGPTTGATYQVAKWIANNNKNSTIVFISADSGNRHQSTIYNDNWLKKNYLDLSANYIQPKHASSLSHIEEPWSYIDWNRRTLKSIITS